MPKSYKETLHFKDTVVYFQEEEDKQETLTLCDLLGECE